MSSSGNRKKLRLNTVAVSLGCNCRRPKLSFIFHRKPKLKSSLYHSSSASSNKKLYEYDTVTNTTNTTATTTFSPYTSSSSQFSDSEADAKTVRGFGRIGGQSLAVEKDSDDPYLDFRHSMLQMILEKEIYSKDDLRELLNCFLQLNSPYYHGVIVRAFTEIWNGVYSVKSASSVPSPKLHYGRVSRDH